MLNLIDGFSIFGLNIKFYGILMATAMLVGVLLACHNAKKRGLTADNIYVLALFILPLAVIGARLVYVLGADRTYSFLEVFKIWEGGMSIYGGIIGGALGVLLFCIVYKKKFLDIADIACVSLILGQAIGRWGNFFNQEVYGNVVTNPSWQWFPFAVMLDNGEWHYALFFYEFLINLAIFAILMLIFKKTEKRGLVTSVYLISYGTIRFLLEPLRVAEYNLMLFGIKLSSLISAFAVLAGIVCLVLIYTKSKRRKGLEKE
ncbi:MAG: prolipoprotein diacylglyceryl transferase [Clostridia bacterium]|nr:prolipoprotein diacylglyceryl transferase [Clostridia bacterium]